MRHIVELQQIARDAGVMHVNDMYSNKELIRAIQRVRGVQACYLTDERFTCDSTDCEWQSNCKKLVAAWTR